MVRGRLDSEDHAAAKPQADEPHVSVLDGQVVHVLDRQVFEELLATFGNDTGRVRSVYRKFVDTAATRLDEVRHQPAAASAATFHALKGSAGMLGANRLAAVAARLQEVALGLTEETKAAGIGELEAELATFRRVLSAQLSSLPPDQ
jgi:HPt (histidine-containing phosphotransfer) domain-containing protein